ESRGTRPGTHHQFFVESASHGVGHAHFARPGLPHRGSRLPAHRDGHLQGPVPRNGGTHFFLHHHFFKRTPAEGKPPGLWCDRILCDLHDRRGGADAQGTV